MSEAQLGGTEMQSVELLLMCLCVWATMVSLSNSHLNPTSFFFLSASYHDHLNLVSRFSYAILNLSKFVLSFVTSKVYNVSTHA